MRRFLENELARALIVLTAVFFLAQGVAAATSTLRGAAWWGDQYQYLYFNCLDDVMGDRLDVPGNLNAPPPPLGFHFYSPPCLNLVHGVYINDQGIFSGEAWNYSKGLVAFAGTSTPPDGGASASANCPATCNSSNNCWACYNENDQRVYGWARVVTDGTWIRLDSATTTPVKLQGWDYQVNPVLPGHSILPGDFVGTATSTAGNFSFNCESEGGGGGNCFNRNYKVYISNPQIGHMSAPNWTYSQACTSGALRAVLRWQLKSGTQAGFEIVVNTSDSFATSTGNYICWSGVKNPSVATQYTIPNSDPTCGSLSYDTNYYWWIRIYDASGEVSQWYQFGAVDGHNGATDLQTDGNPDGNNKTFSTYKHEFPSPFFSWSPYEVLVGTTTEFASHSKVYTAVSPAVPIDCEPGSYCQYLWSTTDTGALIGSTTAPTTTINFLQATGTTVTLRVTDADNYFCSTSTVLQVNYDLPIWREVRAQ